MMDAEIRARWAAALRSGKYEQGCAFLRQLGTEDCVHRHCCLGVLCDVVDPDGWVMSYDAHTYEHRGEVGVPGASVRAATGLSMTEAHTLIDMNDSGKTFAEIANWIEGNL